MHVMNDLLLTMVLRSLDRTAKEPLRQRGLKFRVARSISSRDCQDDSNSGARFLWDQNLTRSVIYSRHTISLRSNYDGVIMKEVIEDRDEWFEQSTRLFSHSTLVVCRPPFKYRPICRWIARLIIWCGLNFDSWLTFFNKWTIHAKHLLNVIGRHAKCMSSVKSNYASGDPYPIE